MQRFRGRPSRALATVLFTDIVGSTTRAAELGDARWQALLSRHHELVRRLLRRYRGREIDTAGDGFFAVFDNPAQAVGCATTLRDKVRALGIEIRVGVHTGEVEQSGASIRGIAVHLGARIMSVAGPSEVLVSSTVRELTAGSDFTFTDRGSHQLKGVPDARRLFAVEPAADVRSELPAVTGAPATTVGTHATPRPRIGKVMLVALLSLSALGIVVAMWAVGQLSPARPAAFVDPAPNTLARLDLGSGQSHDALRVASGPVAVVATVEGLWVASAGEGRVPDLL